MKGYLQGLERLRERDFEVLCPGHGPAVWQARAKLTEYIEHRCERERLVLEALALGRRTVAELIAHAWSDVPVELRPVAVVTLAAHLDKLAQEGRLPADVQRPALYAPVP
jgi:glyoxylase-like metal-dependent hydrolase (beta-lactamase superfamily II)